MNTDRLLSIPADEYHAASRSGRYMSSHLLADFRESPALYNKEIKGEIEQKNTPAFILGRAAHSLILAGRHAFDRDFVVTDGQTVVVNGTTWHHVYFSRGNGYVPGYEMGNLAH